MTLYDYVATEFERLIGSKTGWGKNEIIQAFHKAFAIGTVKYAASKGISLE